MNARSRRREEEGREADKRRSGEESTRKASPMTTVPTGITIFIARSWFSSRSSRKKRPRRSGRYASESVFEISSGESSERSKQKKRRRSRSRQKKQKRRGRRRKRKRVMVTEHITRQLTIVESSSESDWRRSRR